jgi:sugar phosphate permease
VSPEPLRTRDTLLLVIHNRPLVWVFAALAVAAFSSVGMMQWLPMFFMRSHKLSHAQIGVFFGPVLAGGLIVGGLVGGWIGARLARTSIRSLLVGCSWPLLALMPLYAVMLLTTSLPLALALTFVATALAVSYNPIAATAWQGLCDARVRGTATGIHGFTTSLIGGAVLPFTIGALSDALGHNFGEQSLRYALLAAIAFVLIAAALFRRASRLI